MDPLRTLQQGTSERDASASSSLSLIKALVEANRAQFNIKRATNSGTLIEVVFSPARE